MRWSKHKLDNFSAQTRRRKTCHTPKRPSLRMLQDGATSFDEICHLVAKNAKNVNSGVDLDPDVELDLDLDLDLDLRNEIYVDPDLNNLDLGF